MNGMNSGRVRPLTSPPPALTACLSIDSAIQVPQPHSRRGRRARGRAQVVSVDGGRGMTAVPWSPQRALTLAADYRHNRPRTKVVRPSPRVFDAAADSGSRGPACEQSASCSLRPWPRGMIIHARRGRQTPVAPRGEGALPHRLDRGRRPALIPEGRKDR